MRTLVGLAAGLLAAQFVEGAEGILASGVKVNGRMVSDCEWRHERDGEAVRYRLPGGKRTVEAEDTVWQMPEDAVCWYQEGAGGYECPYVRSLVRDMPFGRILCLPMTFKLKDGTYRMMTEANLVDYTDSAVVYEGKGRFRILHYAERGPFEQTGTDTTPWRGLITAKDLNELFNCDLVRRLCPEPFDAKSVELHRPGRAIWQWLPANGPVYSEQKDWYDRTKALGYEYYLIDAGWRDWREDGKDQWACLKSAIDYGRSLGVQSVIWVDSKEIPTAEKRREYLDKVAATGAVGIKIDFVPPCSSYWCKWYEETLADTAAHGLFVDFHGCVKPTGREKTWPHELAREAIRGHEWHITRYNRVLPPEHDCILPFCRLVQGHGDYTPMVFEKSQLIHFTWARQLAQGIVFAAPFLCFGDFPRNYEKSPARTLVEALPSVYDETHVLPGSEIGECVALARRRGSTWFLAVENGAVARSLTVDLGFLAGKTRMIAFGDAPDRLDAFVKTEREVSPGERLALEIRPCGGFVAMLTDLAKTER